ncbi:hypothetical protein V8F33_007011 [Rhypophila sp. PSN 637]
MRTADFFFISSMSCWAIDMILLRILTNFVSQFTVQFLLPLLQCSFYVGLTGGRAWYKMDPRSTFLKSSSYQRLPSCRCLLTLYEV